MVRGGVHQFKLLASLPLSSQEAVAVRQGSSGRASESQDGVSAAPCGNGGLQTLHVSLTGGDPTPP